MEQKVGQVFEITDHTTATDWERFIADLEETIVQIRKDSKDSRRNKDKVSSTTSEWLERNEDIKFGNFLFKLSYRWLDEQSEEDENFKSCLDENTPRQLPSVVRNLLDSSNDFVYGSLCLDRWYNLKKFIVLYPKDDYIITENKIKLVLSSASIASSNVSSQVPIFVQIHHPRVNFYQGISEHENVRVTYEMAYFKQGCRQYRYLSEVINLFREKVGVSLNDPITATIRLNYTLDTLSTKFNDSLSDSHNRSFSIAPPRASSMLSSSTTSTSEPRFSLDFLEMVEYLMHLKTKHHQQRQRRNLLHVGVIWPPMSDKIVSDTPVHSDLNPADAPIWTLQNQILDLPSNDQNPTSNVSMASIISMILEKNVSSYENEPILDSICEDWSNEIALVFEKFQSKILRDIMEFIFTVSSENSPQNPDTKISSKKDLSWSKQCKAAPVDSIVDRIALALAITLVYSNNPRESLSQIWKAILCELRRYYDRSQLIPISNNSCTYFQNEVTKKNHFHNEMIKPDHGTCLLYQKLQMLNCCIIQKIRSNQQNKTDQEQIIKSDRNIKVTNEEDEEFYDCDADEEEVVEPKGRLEQLEDLCLLDRSERLYIPITQDTAPLTEDALQDYTTAMTRLARKAQDEISVKVYQSAGLVSDMSAFKAANPGCRFEDFVRWFSPKDWILDCDKNGKPIGDKSSSKSGRLTHRMLMPGCLWYELWEAAKPEPVSEQKLLFDHRKEAEKVFQYLAKLSLRQMFDNIIPVLLATTCFRLDQKLERLLSPPFSRSQTPDQVVAQDQNDVEVGTENGSKKYKAPRDLLDLFEARNYQELFSTLSSKECQVNQIDALIKLFDSVIDCTYSKFNASDDFHKSLDQLKHECRQLCYELSTSGEIVVSKNSSDDIRKLLAILFSFKTETFTTVLNDAPGASNTHSTDDEKDDIIIRRLLRNFGRDNRTTTKEFIIRCEKHMLNESGIVPDLPQRLFCTITDDDFRLCGAFSQVCG